LAGFLVLWRVGQGESRRVLPLVRVTDGWPQHGCSHGKVEEISLDPRLVRGDV
jgi:hypothetical protein